MKKDIFKDFIQTNYDLEDKFKEVKIPIVGIFNKDNLPYNLENGNYVINLDTELGNGTHWCGFYKHNNLIIYFDSYRLPPPEETMKIMKPCEIFYNDKIIQHINTSSCGYWVIAFFCWLHRVKYNSDMLDHYQRFIDLFDGENQEKNEIYLKKFLLPF